MLNSLKNLLKDSAIYGTAELLNRSLQILLLPLIFIYLKTESFGVLDYFLTIKNLFSTVLGIGLSTVIQRYYIYKDNYSLSQIISASFIILLIVDAFFIIFTTIFSNDITQALLNGNFRKELILSCATSSLFALRSIPLGTLRVKRQAVKFLIVSVMNFIFYLLSSFILIKYYNLGYFSFLYGGLVGILLSTLMGVLFIKKDIVWSLPKGIISTLLTFGFSILASSSSILLIGSINRIFLKYHGTFSDLAIFGMANRISLVVGALLVAPFSLAWLPFVSAKFKENKAFDKIINSVYLIYSFIGVFLILGVSFFSNEMFILIGQTEYIESSKYIPLFSIAFLFQGYYFIFAAGIFIKGASKDYYKVSTFTILGTLILYACALPFINVNITSYITMMSFILLFFCGRNYGKSIIKIRLLQREIIVLFSLGLIGLIANHYTISNELNWILILIKLGFMAVLSLISFLHLRNKLLLEELRFEK